MKGRVIVIDMPTVRTSQAALLVDGRLEDLLLDPSTPDPTPMPGEIYWAKVDRVLPSGGGAFVHLCSGQTGYLRETKGIKAGGGVLVQVSGLPDPGKAVPVTRRLLFKTRLVIHTPEAPGINVSRQIKDPDERTRLTETVQDWRPDPAVSAGAVMQHYEDMHQAGGFIVRSAAKGADPSQLHQAIALSLAARSEHEAVTRSDAPGTTAANTLSAQVALREWTDIMPEMIAVTDRFARRLQTEGVDRVVGLDAALRDLVTPGDGDPFDHFGVWDQVENLRQPEVTLPSGGTMIIEATRAMITVDINTGESFSDGAGITTNVEAARELPRQLRLRGLGGQAIIDFAPMKKMHRKKIDEVLKAAFRRDPVPTTLAGWTPLGNFELQRKRERRPLDQLLSE